MSFLATPFAKYGAIVLAALTIAAATWWILDDEFDKGEKSGKAAVTGAVQADTIQKTDDASKAKDKAKDDVSKTPYSDLVDGL